MLPVKRVLGMAQFGEIQIWYNNSSHEVVPKEYHKIRPREDRIWPVFSRVDETLF